MEYLYIDESGSMTTEHSAKRPYFVISIVRVKDIEKLKKTYKRFVSSHMNELKKADERKLMFKGSRFVELKGSCFTPKLKHDFVKYFCQNNYFEVFYIVLDNAIIQPKFYNNTARAFNYIIRLALEYYINHSYISDSSIILQLDERNERTETKYFLENYLRTELCTKDLIKEDCTVRYFDSSNNKLIQIADVFANLMFTELHTKAYCDDFLYMKENGYLKHIFKFPI